MSNESKIAKHDNELRKLRKSRSNQSLAYFLRLEDLDGCGAEKIVNF